jgi:hypothetical protein
MRALRVVLVCQAAGRGSLAKAAEVKERGQGPRQAWGANTRRRLPPPHHINKGKMEQPTAVWGQQSSPQQQGAREQHILGSF